MKPDNGDRPPITYEMVMLAALEFKRLDAEFDKARAVENELRVMQEWPRCFCRLMNGCKKK